MSGTWKMETGKRTIYENWTIAGNNEMQSKNYLLRSLDTVILEKVKLALQPDGIYYIPIISGQNDSKPVPFKMISSLNKKFVFENAEHDFPQRVIYHLVNEDSVHAWIEGKNKGKDARMDYYFRRVR
jgi:hypothetical protein